MTEDEAKTKWCPMVRIGIGEGSSANRSWVSSPEELPKTDNHCVGSDCMMWRWSFVQKTDSETFPSEGYCGLAPLRGPASIPPAPVVIQPSARRIAGGVYSNPQPGDADFPGEPKMDIGSGG